MVEISVVIAPKAERAIRKLPKFEPGAILRAIAGLKSDPRPRGVDKLKQNPNFWRLRVGDYRVVYLIEARPKRVVVALVRHRKNAYRGIEKLDP